MTPHPARQSHRLDVELHVTPRGYSVLQSWLCAVPGYGYQTMRAWLSEIGRNPEDFEWRQTNIVVDYWRTK